MISLPNPFIPLQDQLINTLYVHESTDWLLSMKICLFLSLSIIILSVIIRARASGAASVWILRKENELLIPHTVFLTLFFSVLFILLDLFYLIYFHSYSKIGQNLKGAIFFRTTVFSPLWGAGWCLSWNMDLFKTCRGYKLIGFLFISTPLLFFLILFSLTGVAEYYWQRVYSIFLILDKALTIAIEQFDAGIGSDSLGLLKLQIEISTESENLVYWWRCSIGFLAVMEAVSILVFITVTIAHALDLWKTIRSYKDTTEAVLTLKKSFYSIFLTSVGALIIHCLYLALAICLLLNIESFLFKPNLGNLLLTLATSIYAYIGLPTNLVFLYRSIQIYSLSRSSRDNSSTLRPSQPPSFLNTFDKKLARTSTDFLDFNIDEREGDDCSIISNHRINSSYIIYPDETVLEILKN